MARRSLAIAAAALWTAALVGCSGEASGTDPAPAEIARPPRHVALPEPAASELPPLGDGPVLTVARHNRLIWPASGPITTYFGLYHPTGIDIGLDWDEDSPIRAAMAGEVTFAGGSACCGYGIYVEVEAGGLKTLYGHLSRLNVEAGQQVSQGQVLGLGGATGVSDGKHLHLELYQDGVAVDPLRFLPSSQATLAEPRLAYCGGAPIQVDPASRLTIKLASAQAADYGLGEVKVTSSAARALAIEVSESNSAEVVVDLPQASTASGQTFEAFLEVTLSKGEESGAITCELLMPTLRTLPNPPPSRRAAALTSPPTVTPTPTPFFWQLPPATPFPPAPTPIPIDTPRPLPTATPRVATPATGPIAATPTRAGGSPTPAGR